MSFNLPEKECWTCTIGEINSEEFRKNGPQGADLPMRDAIAKAYREVTGQECNFIFSGWGHELPEKYRAVVEDRLPNDS